MDFDVPKRVNRGNTHFQRVSIGGFAWNPNLYWKLGENDFLSITRQKCIIGQNELGGSNKCFVSNFREKKFFGPEKNFGPFPQRK